MEGNSERDLSLKSREVDESKSAETNLYSNTEPFNLYSIPQIPIQEEEEEDDDSDEVRSGGQGKEIDFSCIRMSLGFEFKT